MHSLVIKFIDEKYLNNYLEKGEIFFTPNIYFKKVEETNVPSIGDSGEGIRVVSLDPKNTKITLTNNEGVIIPIESFGRAIISEHITQLDNIPIACFTYLCMEDLESVSESEFKIKEEIVEGLAAISNGRNAVISLGNDWLKQNKAALDEYENTYTRDKVSYYEEDVFENISDKEYSENPIAALFKKRKKFEKQKELRIVLEEFSEKGIIFSMGDISSFSISVTIEELKAFRMKGR